VGFQGGVPACGDRFQVIPDRDGGHLGLVGGCGAAQAFPGEQHQAVDGQEDGGCRLGEQGADGVFQQQPADADRDGRDDQQASGRWSPSDEDVVASVLLGVCFLWSSRLDLSGLPLGHRQMTKVVG